jgi:hypothetical protein
MSQSIPRRRSQPSLHSWPRSKPINIGHLLGTLILVHHDTSPTEQDLFTEYTACSSKDSMIFNGGVENTVVGKGNVYFLWRFLFFLNVYYVPSMELNLLLVSQIMRHYPHLDVNFSNHKCYIVD